METLTIIHAVEAELGRDLTDKEFCRICAYLHDGPMGWDAQYLIELFDLPKADGPLHYELAEWQEQDVIVNDRYVRDGFHYALIQLQTSEQKEVLAEELILYTDAPAPGESETIGNENMPINWM